MSKKALSWTEIPQQPIFLRLYRSGQHFPHYAFFHHSGKGGCVGGQRQKNSPWRYTGNPCRAAQRAGGKGHCHLQMRRLHRRRSGGGNRGHHHHALRASFSPGFPGLSIFKSGPLSEYSGPLFCFLQGKFTQHPPGAAAPGSWRHLPLSRWAWGKCRCCWRPRRAACRLL